MKNLMSIMCLTVAIVASFSNANAQTNDLPKVFLSCDTKGGEKTFKLLEDQFGVFSAEVFQNDTYFTPMLIARFENVLVFQEKMQKANPLIFL